MCVRTNFVAYRAPGDFIPKEVRAEGCVEEVCPLGISWSPGLWEKMTRETPKNQIFFFVSEKILGALITWMPQRTMGAIPVVQRCRWSAAQALVTSALRLPSNRRDAGKLSDEEGAVDILARSACGLTFFLQSTCTAFQPRSSCSEVCHPILVQSTSH